MLLGDLLDDEELGLVLLTGREQLDRPVRGIYITDLIDPRRYLEGSELVLSGLVWHTGPDDSERFAAALADAGVAGLAAGTARLGDTPQDLVDACARHGVPLVQVPLAVSFNTLSEHVLRAERREGGPRRELVAAVASGAGLDRTVRLARSELGTGGWVLSGVGAVVGGQDPPDRPVVRALVREFLGSERLPRTVGRDQPGGPFVLGQVETGTEPRAARWFTVLPGDHRSWESEHEAIAVDLGTAAALLRSRVDEGRRATGRSVAMSLHGLLDGSIGAAEVVTRLEPAGLPQADSLRVVALEHRGGAEASATLLRELAAATGLPAVTAALGDGAVALFAEAPAQETRAQETTSREEPAQDPVTDLDRLDEHVRAVFTDIAAVDPSHRTPGGERTSVLAAGLSDVGDPAGLRGAVDEARHALSLARRSPDGFGVATAGELATHQVLLAAVPDELRESYRRRLLSRLVAYDEAHRSDLVRTLRVFLECAGSWSRCAERLHVHVNTLRYRIRRVEEITGRDLGDFATRVDFYLALRVNA